MNSIPLCSGFGQYHSVTSATNPKPYGGVCLDEITSMAKKPAGVKKENSQWVIFSSLSSRAHADQKQKGEFYALWADIDENAPALPDLVKKVDGIFSENLIGTDFLVYTSRSATKENQKARVIVPLSRPVNGSVFVAGQRILNDKLEGIGVTPDRANERAGQLCYLPNKGEYYRYHIEDAPKCKFDLCSEWEQELREIEQKEANREQELAGARELALLRATERVNAGTSSPIEAFNCEYDLPLMLDSFGYMRKGKKWISPNSSSHSPAVRVSRDGKKWHSHHESDRDIGRAADGGGTWGDAFDLFTYYQHSGNRGAALSAAGEMFTAGGQTLTKANQTAYMERQSALSVVDDFVSMDPCEKAQFSLDTFSLNGSSKEMEERMLDDKYILGRMAILGQSTAFYAKPNAGKTLLTIWLLIEAIKAGEITAGDVYYVNADDNHKGLTQKLKLAEQYGFKMIAPGYNNFTAKQFAAYLNQLVATDTARGKVLILDTLKKFTDLMKKDRSSDFGEVVRQFVSHGGSVVMLAHTNKHRGDDGKLIAAGTSDIVDDADCAFMLDELASDPLSGKRIVQFSNFKSRGDVAMTADYEYDASEGATYLARLASVRAVSDEERHKVEQQNKRDRIYRANKEAIEAIKGCLNDGISLRTDLIKEAQDRSAISKRKVTKALDEHTGSKPDQHQYWHKTIGDKNAHIYALNYGCC